MTREDQDGSPFWGEEGSPFRATSAESAGSDVGKRMARDAAITALVALLIHVGLNVFGNLTVREGAYRLHPRGLAAVAEFLGLLLVVEWPVILIRFGYDHMDDKVLRKPSRQGFQCIF